MNRRTFFTSLLAAGSAFIRPVFGSIPRQAQQPVLSEWDKCKTDPVYFIEKYVFKRPMLSWQKAAARAYQTKNVLGVTCRRAGKTELIKGLVLHRGIFFDNVVVGYESFNPRAKKVFAKALITSFIALPDEFRLKGPIIISGGTCRGLGPLNNAIYVLHDYSGIELTDIFLDETARVSQERLETALHYTKATRKCLLSSPIASRCHDFRRFRDQVISRNDWYTLNVSWQGIHSSEEINGYPELSVLND